MEIQMKKELVMTVKAIQDYYPDEFANCFGCGRLNPEGLKIRSYWKGDESVCHYTPGPHYTGGFPGYLYGGLIAALIDCHGAATASAGKLHADGFKLGEKPLSRFVSASLKVDYLKPTPMGKVLELRGRIREIKGRKVTASIILTAGGEMCARGEVVMVELKKAQ
ncbi:MAG: PaaI family thioesterase [Syntrophales bacterium]